MNILLLTITDQSNHPMGAYVDLHCNYDFGNWVLGFSGLPYDCYSFNYYKSFVERGPLTTEQIILGLVREHQIDLVIVPNMYYELNAAFLEKLRNAGTKSLIVFFDDSGRFEDINRYYLRHCDYILTHESKNALNLYRPYGVSVKFFPCFPSLAFYDRLLRDRADAIPNLRDVSFVGANIVDREAFWGALSKAGLPVEFYGSGWPNGRVPQTAMLKIFRDSKISLNFTKSLASGGGKQLKARAFEIILAGGFLLTEYDDELVSYFEVGKEIDTFSSLEECVQKTRYYLENPLIRESMRQRAIKKCREKLNFEAAWSQYLVGLDKQSELLGGSSAFGIAPNRAIRSFVRWNLCYLVGRLSTKQPRLALDQSRWALREALLLSGIYSRAIWLVVFSEVSLFFLRGVKRRVVRATLLQKIKPKLARLPRVVVGGSE